MPSPSERQRNNVRAGVFVTIALFLTLAVITILSDVLESLTRTSRDYSVTFDVSSGVSNLKCGSEVRVGGVAMGTVDSISPLIEEGQAFRTIVVQFNVDRRIELFADATVIVSAPLIGSEAWLDVPDVGDPSAGAPPNARIIGTASAGFLTTLLGSQNADRAGDIIENVRVATADASEITRDFRSTRWPLWSGRLDEILENSRQATGDVRALTADIRNQRWPQWAESVNKVMTWAAAATDKFDAAIADGHGLLTDGRAVVAENREGIKSIVGNVKTTTDRINAETIEKIHALLDTGQQGLDQAVLALENLRVDYAGWSVNIGEALANANLAAQQLKLTTIETRRSPWKLLYRPSPTELEHELLYESARSFAVAAADLKAASESVERVLANHRDLLADDQQMYQRIENNLLKSLDNYEKAQQQLIDVLFADEVSK